ncbi:MAG: NUDIX hydrolase [bacterium]
MEEENKILEFGTKREQEERRDGGCTVVFDPQTKLYAVYKHPRTGVLCLFGGGFDEGESEEDGCLRELKEESGLADFLYTEKIDRVICHYFNRNKKIYRMAHASCFLVVLNSLTKGETKLEEHESDFEFMLSTKEEILNNWESFNEDKDYDHWIYFLEKASERLSELGYTP